MKLGEYFDSVLEDLFEYAYLLLCKQHMLLRRIWLGSRRPSPTVTIHVHIIMIFFSISELFIDLLEPINKTYLGFDEDSDYCVE